MAGLTVIRISSDLDTNYTWNYFTTLLAYLYSNRQLHLKAANEIAIDATSRLQWACVVSPPVAVDHSTN